MTPDYSRAGDYLIPNDYATLTQGQLKNLAVAAYDELQANAPGGATPKVKALIQKILMADPTTGQFILDSYGRRQEAVSTSTLDFAPVNLGQLKAVALPFYDYFVAMGMIPGFPWLNTPNAADDFALANIGQAKALFCFDLSQGAPGQGASSGSPSNLWNTYYHQNPLKGGGASANPSGDGLTNLQKFQLGLDPAQQNNTALQLSAFGFATP